MESETRFLFKSNIDFIILTIFNLNLTSPPQKVNINDIMGSNGQSIDFYVQNDPEAMCLTACVRLLLFDLLVSDLL